jgi:murein DD-endopeptidase MepM/ murein hydrolase activator NlpD
VNRRWFVGLIVLAGLVPAGAGAQALSGDPVADRFSFPVGDVANSPTVSRYQAPGGHIYLGWAVPPAASFLSPAYGAQLQPGEDWGGRGGGNTGVGQPVYAAAAGTILAAGYYGPTWGNIVLIRHTLPGGQVVLTQYAYMADVVKTAGTVQWRDVIGHIGMGPHGAVLHFEVRQDSMLDFPPDYWPSSDGKDDTWVRTHYYGPTSFVRTHYRILSPLTTPAPPSSPSGPGGDPPPAPGPVVGTAPGPSFPGTVPSTPGGLPGSFPLFPDPQPTSGTFSPSGPLSPSTPPSVPLGVWDGVPHLDGSILLSGTGVYFLLQSGKKWLIPNTEVLSTWARPAEALPVTDAELASYPVGSHVLGLRAGTVFRGPGGHTCISSDPFDAAGLACWVIPDDNQLASLGIPRDAVKSVSAQTVGIYVRPTPFDNEMLLPRGTLINQAWGGYYVVEDLNSYWPEVHPVTSPAALHSWQVDEGMAVEVSGQDFWGRALKLDPVGFRSGALLQSSAGQYYVVSGAYKYRADAATLQRRGYNLANAILVTDAELALQKDWPAPLP